MTNTGTIIDLQPKVITKTLSIINIACIDMDNESSHRHGEKSSHVWMNERQICLWRQKFLQVWWC